ncbi:odorant receptor 47a-like [Chelonus insularis]|uniref:odorant receptor 47a-like n=1 Tax=Chelonus insularis TaxID=460826 RepID=UPI0015891991|nr:odorant receptor 47a-like [Chelonus insularis]
MAFLVLRYVKIHSDSIVAVTRSLSVMTGLFTIALKMKSITILRAIRILAYVLTKVIQTYMYSWCGTHLTMESEEYRNAIYSADWYGEKRFMTAIIIMLKQRPLILSACHFSTVSVDIFMKILNTTVSYYFLIKTLEA